MRKYLLSVALLCTSWGVAPLAMAQKTVGSAQHQGVENDEPTPSQRNCLTVDKIRESLQANPQLVEEYQRAQEMDAEVLSNPNMRTQGVITIPVVVHVVYDNSSANISDAQILSQITVLNDDYRRTNADASNTPASFLPVAADTEIEFCLAQRDPQGNSSTGITRTSTTTNNIGNTNQYYQVAPAWDRNKYLNIWVCEIGGGILGYAYPPGSAPASYDGVVIDYRYFGTTGTAQFPFNKGRTATHEVGHWLNLRHIWGDGGCGVDDGIADTPESDNPNFNCPTTHVSCGTTDMVQNYMDYTDDACMNIFTQGQASVMQATLSGSRGSLVFSNGCQPVGGGGGTACGDTVTVNYPLTGTPVLYGSGGSGAWGYVAGHNQYGDIGKANYFANSSNATTVYGVRFEFGAAAAASANSKVTVQVWDGSGGTPGSSLGSVDLLINDIIAGQGDVTAYFSSPVTVSGPYFAGITFTYAAGDTVGLVTNSDGETSPATAWEKWNTNDWYAYDDASSWQLDIAHAIFPLVAGTPISVSVSPTNPTIAQGGNVALTASGASTYTWSPGTGLSGTTGSSVTASPTTTTTYTVIGTDGSCSDTTTVTVTVTGVSIDDASFTHSLQLFPNPSEGIFTLAFEMGEPQDLDIKVFNGLGQVVYNESRSGFSGNYRNQIDLSNEARGVYFLSISDGVSRHTEKIVLK